VVHLRLGKLFVSGTVHVNITQAYVACSVLTTLRMRLFSLLLIGAGAGAFDRSRVSWKNESRGIYYSYTAEDGSKTKISPWHDIPFTLGKDDGGAMLLSFVCEIPRNSRPKIEIHKSEPYNPLLQDVKKDGSLRYYMYSDSLVNYGAITQTWEDPNKKDPDTGLGGDNDPIDVLQLNESPCERGAIQRVRVLGGLALIDEGETDWKLLVVDVDAADAPNWRDVSDIPKTRVDELRDFFRLYKTAEGKPENKYGLDGRAVDAAHALVVATGTHVHWAEGRKGNAECEFKTSPCWMGLSQTATKGEL